MSEVISKEQLQQYINKIERLDSEKATIAEEIKDVFAEAKGNGFDVQTLKQVIRIKKMDRNKLVEQEELLDLYRGALGI